MEEILSEPKRRLVVAAIECIESDGLEGVTVRSIATRAEANVAAIAYHFGSKDALLEIALETAWENAASDLREFLASEPWDPRGGLERMMLFLLKGAIEYPRLTSAHISSERPACKKAAEEMARLFTRAAGRSVLALGASERGVRPDRVAAFLAACVFPTLARSFFSEAFGLDLSDERIRNRYVSGAVGDFLKDLAGPD